MGGREGEEARRIKRAWHRVREKEMEAELEH